MTRDRHGEHARLERTMVQAALGNPPVPPIPSQSNGNPPRIVREEVPAVKRSTQYSKPATGLVGPSTPLFSVTQFVILREAQKIREIPDYRPAGWMTILEWAKRIEENHAR